MYSLYVLPPPNLFFPYQLNAQILDFSVFNPNFIQITKTTCKIAKCHHIKLRHTHVQTDKKCLSNNPGKSHLIFTILLPFAKRVPNANFSTNYKSKCPVNLITNSNLMRKVNKNTEINKKGTLKLTFWNHVHGLHFRRYSNWTTMNVCKSTF